MDSLLKDIKNSEIANVEDGFCYYKHNKYTKYDYTPFINKRVIIHDYDYCIKCLVINKLKYGILIRHKWKFYNNTTKTFENVPF